MKTSTLAGAYPVKRAKRKTLRLIWRYRYLYLFILPAGIYFLIFSYIPYYHLQIAFKDYQIFKGTTASPWVGLQNFQQVFSSDKFPQLMFNTVYIHLTSLIFGFPVPILFALLLNEVRKVWFKKTIQTVTYFPHFLSWVVFGGIVLNIIGPLGIVNKMLINMGLPAIEFITDSDKFVPIVVVTRIIKEFGWNAIIYLAALAGIDPTLYEAAKVDGASKWRQIWHITLPGIRSIIVLLLILNLGHLLDAGFDQILVLQNPAVYDVSDIIDTYVYRLGLLGAQFETATAIGLFKGVVGFVLIVSANALIRKWGEKSLW